MRGLPSPFEERLPVVSGGQKGPRELKDKNYLRTSDVLTSIGDRVRKTCQEVGGRSREVLISLVEGLTLVPRYPPKVGRVVWSECLWGDVGRTEKTVGRMVRFCTVADAYLVGDGGAKGVRYKGRWNVYPDHGSSRITWDMYGSWRCRTRVQGFVYRLGLMRC